MPERGDFGGAVAEAENWMADLTRRLGDKDRARVYLILGVTLQALRDSLSRDEAVEIGAQLPLLLRGLYYQGWRADGVPVLRTRAAFLGRIRQYALRDLDGDAEEVVRAVFALLAMRLPIAGFEEARDASPRSFCDLWPTRPPFEAAFVH
jgi:uncharacterized protein (DUF2267 family)